MAVLRDISLILLILEATVLTLAVLLVFAAINYLLIRSRWWHVIPTYFALARGYLAQGQQIVERACRALIAPVLAVSGATAGLQDAARRVKRPFTSQRRTQ